MPSAPLRFLESWIQAVLGFVVCIVLPILVYAQAVPFADGVGVAERTIIATALAYMVVVYCGSRLEAFPGASLMDQTAYIAPIVTVCFATIGVALLVGEVPGKRKGERQSELRALPDMELLLRLGHGRQRGEYGHQQHTAEQHDEAARKMGT